MGLPVMAAGRNNGCGQETRSFFIKDGEKNSMPHDSIGEAKKWLGYMVAFYEIKPLRIESDGKIITKNLVVRW